MPWKENALRKKRKYGGGSEEDGGSGGLKDGDGIQEGGGFEDEPDPALDPSLVIPALPPPGQDDSSDGPEDEGGMQEGGGFEDGPDPALDPSLVIPTLQPEETQPEPESPVKPEAARPAKRRAKPAAAPAPDSQKPAARRTAPAATGQRQNKAAAPPKRVVSIDDDVNIQTEDEKEAYLWMELRNSMRSKRILTGILGGVERSANGLCTAVVYYKDCQRQ